MKKRYILVPIVLVLLLYGCAATDIKLSKEEISIEIGSVFNPIDYVASKSRKVEIENNVNVNKIGSYQVTFTKGEKTARLKVNVVDTVSPVVIPSEHYDSYIGNEFSAMDMLVRVTDLSNVKAEFDGQIDYSKKVINKTAKIIVTDEGSNSVTTTVIYSIYESQDDLFQEIYFRKVPNVLSYYGTFRDVARNPDNTFASKAEEYTKRVNGLYNLPNSTKFSPVKELVLSAANRYLSGIQQVTTGVNNKNSKSIEGGLEIIDQGLDLLWDAADKLQELK